MHFAICVFVLVCIVALYNEFMGCSQEEVIELKMNVSGHDYTFVYQEGNDKPHELATLFCKENGDDLGFTKFDIDECIDPLSLELEREIRKQSQILKRREKFQQLQMGD